MNDLKTKAVAYKPTAEEMFNKYHNTVWRLALARVGNTSCADDILQEVFLRAVQKQPTFESEEHCKAWLIKVTVNCSNSFLGSAWRRHFAALKCDIAESFEMPKETSDVYLAVQKLKPRYKTVVHLFYYEDMSVAEIASALNLSESCVKQRLKRAREQLKAFME